MPQLPLQPDALYDELTRRAQHAPPRPSRPLPNLDDALRPTLRAYQREAIEWMIARESDECVALQPAERSTWLPVQLGPCAIFWNLYSGAVSEQPVDEPVEKVRGGILADEMGLGKTVEVLALILAHPRPPADCAATSPLPFADAAADAAVDNDDDPTAHRDEAGQCFCGNERDAPDGTWVACDTCGRWVHGTCAGFDSVEAAEAAVGYECMLCACERGCASPRACGATLLVVPSAILGQWRDEFEKHVRGDRLRVRTFVGLRTALSEVQRNPRLLAECSPASLSASDIVLTSFDVLRSELNHTAQRLDQGRSSRSGSRRHLLSPLLALEWWRVALDEAQEVESSTAAATEMALQLHTVNRWCISGTPLGRNRLADLHGLLTFLRVERWEDRAWWHHAIEAPLSRQPADSQALVEAEHSYEVLVSLLHRILWRNTKKGVESQLNLPPLSYRTHELQLSLIERHFYERQHSQCISQARAALFRQRAAADASAECARSLAGKPTGAHARAAFTAQAKANAAKSALEKLEPVLLRLRQACCHPQLGTHGLKHKLGRGRQRKRGRDSRRLGEGSIASSPFGAAVLSMEEVLLQHIEAQQNQAEEAQRKALLNLAALGSVSLLVRDWCAAARWYARALHLSDHNRRAVALDSGLTMVIRGGPSGFTGPSTAVSAGCSVGPLAWCAATEKEGASEAPPASDGSRWLRLEFSRPVKLSQIRLVLDEKVQRETGDWKCTVLAGTEGGVMVELCTQLLCAADPAIHFFRTSRSRAYQVLLRPPSAGGDASRLRVESLAVYEADIETDPLQLLHISHNLCRALAQASHSSGECGGGGGGEAPTTDGASSMVTIDDDSLRAISDAEAGVRLPAVGTLDAAIAQRTTESIRNQLVGERSAARQSACSLLHEARAATDKAISQRGAALGGGATARRPCAWLELAALEAARNPACETTLHERLVQDDSIPDTARSRAASLQSILSWAKEEEELRAEARLTLLCRLDALPQRPSDDEVSESGECARCRTDWGKTGPTCRHCLLEDHYLAAEGRLFRHRRQRKILADLGPSAVGADAGATNANKVDAFRVDAPIVALVRALARWTRGLAASLGPPWVSLHKEAEAELAALDAFARELGRCRALWRAHFDLLSQLDELGTSTATMRLATSPDEVNALAEVERHVLVGVWEVRQRVDEYAAQLAGALAQLQAERAQLGFLRRIANGGADEGGCPVCFSSWGEVRMVSECGHALCEECAAAIQSRRGGRFVCPLCKRAGTLSIATDFKASAEEEEVDRPEKLEGSWSTKVKAIVELIRRLPAEEKCLIFSQWEQHLELIAAALAMNGVGFHRLGTGTKLVAELDGFKRDPDIKALLLPLARGAKGINLIEAQHVIFAEPLLNAAVEAQAIGRVHRISQTRPATVHSFVVSGTVEEAIVALRAESTRAQGPGDGSKKGATGISKETSSLSWEQVRALFGMESETTMFVE